MARADRATDVEIAGPVTDRNAVERVRIVRAGAVDEVRGVGHWGSLSRKTGKERGRRPFRLATPFLFVEA
jgi:hypothetical protein